MKVEVYTDGACSPNPGVGGWAAILVASDVPEGAREREKVITGAEHDTTNNRMELLAAVRALEALRPGCEVTINTDSQYLAQAFNAGWLKGWQKNGWITSKGEPVKNEDLWRALLDLTAKHTVKWAWVVGHAKEKKIATTASTALNDRCDKLAVEARLKLAGA